MFRDREDAGLWLAARLRGRPLRQPLVLAIPRGGVAVGAVLARELDAELDVVLSRKLHAPHQPELAVGAIAEDGHVYLNPNAGELTSDYLLAERQRQMSELTRRKQIFRAVRHPAAIEGRSIIVTDDGIATGSTMLAALKVINARHPHEVIVAVPVASPERLEEVRGWCDEVVCLATPRYLRAVGQFYEVFRQVDDEQAVALLHEFAPS
jgi:hypothetical protein